MSDHPPRVLHVGKYLPPVPGGIENYLGDLLRVSMRYGVPMGAIVHEKKGYPTPNPDDFGGAKIYPVPTYGRLLYAPVAPSFPWRLRQAIRNFKPDILHLHMPNTSVFAALLLPEARSLPWVVHWHSDVDPRGMGRLFGLSHHGYQFFESAVLRRSARIIATSEDYLAASQTLRPYQPNCRVIPLALDEGRMKSMSETQNLDCRIEWPRWPGKKFLAVGRLTEYKGFEVLLTVMARLETGSLLIGGDGPIFKRLTAIAAGLDLQHRVKLLGDVSAQTLADLYQSADVVCIPSLDRHEAFGLVALEAMYFRKPIIASRISGSGLTWLVGSYSLGSLETPGEVTAWCAALARLGQAPAPVERAVADCVLQEGLSRSWGAIRDVWVELNGRAKAISPKI